MGLRQVVRTRLSESRIVATRPIVELILFGRRKAFEWRRPVGFFLEKYVEKVARAFFEIRTPVDKMRNREQLPPPVSTAARFRRLTVFMVNVLSIKPEFVWRPTVRPLLFSTASVTIYIYLYVRKVRSRSARALRR